GGRDAGEGRRRKRTGSDDCQVGCRWLWFGKMYQSTDPDRWRPEQKLHVSVRRAYGGSGKTAAARRAAKGERE
ncbi:hypothetical protein U1Q18_031779, partial [Sarracenia purpurea var. burkii]